MFSSLSMFGVKARTEDTGHGVGVPFCTTVVDEFPELNEESRFTIAGLGRVDRLTNFCGEKISVTTFVVGLYEDWGRLSKNEKHLGLERSFYPIRSHQGDMQIEHTQYI